MGISEKDINRPWPFSLKTLFHSFKYCDKIILLYISGGVHIFQLNVTNGVWEILCIMNLIELTVSISLELESQITDIVRYYSGSHNY